MKRNKSHFSRFRCDKELKEALQESAELCDRQEADQARHILRIALGLSTDDEAREIERRVKGMTEAFKKWRKP